MINKANFVSSFLSFYTDLVNFMSRLNHRTHFSCPKSHKVNPRISEIMCYMCYCLQNVTNDFNKLCTFTSSLVKDENIIRFCSILVLFFGLYFIV